MEKAVFVLQLLYHQILKRSGVFVVQNPESNLNNAVGSFSVKGLGDRIGSLENGVGVILDGMGVGAAIKNIEKQPVGSTPANLGIGSTGNSELIQKIAKEVSNINNQRNGESQVLTADSMSHIFGGVK